MSDLDWTTKKHGDNVGDMRASDTKGSKGHRGKAIRARVQAPSGAHATGHAGPAITRVLAYRRVSTLEQGKQGNSLDLQRDEIRRYCEYAKLPEPIDFEETESGSAEAQERREQVAKLLKQVRRGDLVLVSKIDRFSRDIVFTISSVREIIKRGARFLSIAEHFDPSTPEGETQMALWASIAQMERARIRERTEGNRKRLRAMGYFVEGKPPFGYVRAQGELPNEKPRRLDVDPEKAKIVREMFDLCIAGNSAVKISAILRDRYPGVLSFESEWILNALKNRVYAGQLALTAVKPKGHTSTIRRPAEWIDAHEPIVSMETWLTAQDALVSRRAYGAVPRKESKTANWIMRGIARCAICGSVIAAAPNSDSGRHTHAGYYVCHRRLKCKSGERCKTAPFHKQAETDEFLLSETEKHFEEIRGELMQNPEPVRNPNADQFESKRADLIAARERLLALVMAGTWSLEVIDRKAKQIESDLMALTIEERRSTIQETDDTIENRNGARQWLEKVAARWPKMDPNQRRAVIAAMVDRIVVGTDKITMQWANAATMATRYANGALVNLRGEVVEPRRHGRPRKMEPVDTGEGLDLEADDADEA
ncbi:MAG: recombinase family protein [Polyangiaceae bacterium]|nr:recombinase family protein [Polyangiaceae bacterium]